MSGQRPDSFFVFPQRDRAEMMAPRIAETCRGYAGGDLRRRQDQLVARLRTSPAPDIALLRELACVRSLQIGKMTGGNASGLPLGSSWYNATSAATRRALDAAPLDTVSLELLADLTLRGSGRQITASVEGKNQGRGPLKEIEPADAAAALYFAVRSGNSNPAVMRACTSMLLRVGDVPMARDCSLRALDRGADSTWHLLRLSAIALWYADTLLGIPTFLSAAAAASSPGDRAELGWHLEPSFDVNECLACSNNGLLNPSMRWSRSYRPKWRLNESARLRFRSQPASELPGWIQAEVNRLGPDTLPMPILEFDKDPSQLFNRTVQAAGLFARNVLLHFRYTSYAGGAFRGCITLDVPYWPPCVPRRAPLSNTYIGVSASIASLWNPATSSPLALVAWAVPARDVAVDTTVTLEFRRWGLVGGTEWDSTVTMQRNASFENDALLMGSMVMPASSRQTVSVIVTQGRTRRGGLFRDDLTPLGTGDLEVSDPILGQAGSGVEWKGDSLPVMIAPLRTFRKNEAATLYYQVRSARTRSDAAVTARFYSGVDADGPFDKQLIAIRFPSTLKAGVNGNYRELRMPNLEKGVYPLELTLTVGGQRVGEARSALFGIQ
ncbi:MAG: hypothetical protein V4558_15555 [Gemmatimonadota bacterium]